MIRYKKLILSSIILSLIMVVIYFVAVANPTNTLSRKACTSWSIVKDSAFLLSQPGKLTETIELPDNFKVQKGTAEEVPVLMYHYITPKEYNKEPGNKSVINLEAFEENMKYLYEQGYYTASLEELEKYVHGEISLPLKTVVITFDDGYQNNYIYAYPILKKYGFRAAIFIIGARIEEQTVDFDPAKKSFLSYNELEASSDIFEYHSHTYDLHQKGFEKCGVKYSSALDRKLIENDIAKFKSLGIDTPYFAYPFGEKRDIQKYLLQKMDTEWLFQFLQALYIRVILLWI